MKLTSSSAAIAVKTLAAMSIMMVKTVRLSTNTVWTTLMDVATGSILVYKTVFHHCRSMIRMLPLKPSRKRRRSNNEKRRRNASSTTSIETLSLGFGPSILRRPPSSLL